MKMSLPKTLLLVLSIVSFSLFAQVEKEVVPPFNIKTITFVQNNTNTVPIFNLTDSFQFQFDDLFGNEANYYYEIAHCNYDWKPSDLSKNEFLQGFDGQRIQDYSNSYNTLQMYSHYSLAFPNRFTRFLVSGNYMLKILNEDKEVVFSRKFILYEDMVSVSTQVKRARNIESINTKQNLEFTIKSNTILFQSPLQNVKVLLLQNGRLNSGITNIKPMFTIGNDLMYKYNTETQFWAGNEFLYFDNKEIRSPGNSISFVDTNNSVYNSHLFTNAARANLPYTYNPDVNGNFQVRNLNATKNEIEADYAWVYFTLSAPTIFQSDVYINGLFNNYNLIPENKMDYNAAKGIYEKALLIKQGFTNYQYELVTKNQSVDEENAIDGNFQQTENNYSVLVYYRENNRRFDRIIGKGTASSINIIN
jgi:hypothetical protein